MKIKYIVLLLTGSLVASGLTGCASFKPSPDMSPKTSVEIKSILKDFDPAAIIDSYDHTNDTAKQIIRDDYINKRIALIDLNYKSWINSSAFGKNCFDTAAQIAVLGVDAAGTLTGAAETKSILAAVSGGITGSYTTVDKNFFYSQTMQALVAAMDAERAKALLPIVTGENKLDTDYPLPTAVSDLNQYYFAGTLLGALNGIQATSASVAATNNAAVTKTMNIKSTAQFNNRLLQQERAQLLSLDTNGTQTQVDDKKSEIQALEATNRLLLQ